MVKYLTPDSLASAYFEALEALASLPAQRLSETVAVCHRCGGPESKRRSGAWHVRAGAEDDWYTICADCGSPWRPDEIEVGLIRAASAVREDVAERMLHAKLDRLRPLRPIMEPRPRDWTALGWLHVLWLWDLYLSSGRCVYARTARLAQEARFGTAPSAGQVERAIGAARAIVERRMHSWDRRRARNLAAIQAFRST